MVEAPLVLEGGRKKQWLQLGVDPYGLRVQLHVLTPTPANPNGCHVIHARVTPPPPCTLTLTFTNSAKRTAALLSPARVALAPLQWYTVSVRPRG